MIINFDIGLHALFLSSNLKIDVIKYNSKKTLLATDKCKCIDNEMVFVRET